MWCGTVSFFLFITSQHFFIGWFVLSYIIRLIAKVEKGKKNKNKKVYCSSIKDELNMNETLFPLSLNDASSYIEHILLKDMDGYK